MSRAFELSNVAPIAGRKFGEVLIEMKLLTEEQLQAAIQRGIQKKLRLGDLLLSEGVITPTEHAKTLALQHGLEFLDLDTVVLNKEASKLLPEKIARNFLLLPIDAKEGFITLTTHDPIQLMKLDNLKKFFNDEVILRVSTKAQIEVALNKTYNSENSVERIVEHLAKKQEIRKPVSSTSLNDELLNGGDSTPSIESLVNKFIERAIHDRASDIHLDPAEEKVRVRIRIDGILHELYTFPVELLTLVVSRLKILAQLDISEKRNPQDGHFTYVQGSNAVDIRVSTLPTVKGEKAVLRLLDKAQMKGSLTQIGMSTEIVNQVQSLLLRPFGMIFITGPTGSGKTTTLYSMLNQVDGVEKNIITVEDPVEYKFDTINQVQVNEKAGLGFVGLLRSILRQDPDVMMIGEVRDQETAEIAIRAALTGHLVLSTLHTNDAVSTPNRLIDMGIKPFLVSSALIAVLAQRLVRVLCTHCKEKVVLTEVDIKMLGTQVLNAGSTVYGPVGCERCLQSGYRNRIALFELMAIDDAISRAIMDGKSNAEIYKYLAKSGFTSMRQDGVCKIAAGLTSVEEVLKATL